MATKVSRAVPRRPAEVIIKIALSLFGVFAVAWGGWSLPVFHAQASPQFVAAKLLQGDSYKMPRLLLTERQAEAVAARYPFCNPAALHNLTAIRLGIIKDSIGGSDPSLLESSYDASYAAARQTLTCSPADSFVWLTLFWIDAVRHGVTANNEKYLRMSYITGPNEAWIALWRSQLVFAAFDGLPPDLADDGVNDFINLVNTYRPIWQMAAVFEKTSQNGQHHIIAGLKSANAIPREALINVLRDKGLDLSISGEAPNEPRPWR
jgi:hypothetical protein